VSSADLALSDPSELTAEALLASPRGRSLCVNLLDDRLTAPGGRVRRAWVDAVHAARTSDVGRCARQITKCVGLADLSGAPFDESALLAGLLAVVDFASYRDEPDAEDRGFAHEAARVSLLPVAEAVAEAVAVVPAVHWWTEPVNCSRQLCTQFLDDYASPEPSLAGAGESAAAWLADTRDDEHAAQDWPEGPAAPSGGPWRSAPSPSRLPVTTRGLPVLGAVGMALVEDGAAWQAARCWPVAPADGSRVYEISGPRQWAALVNRYPLDVSSSRRHQWSRATGRAGRWLIPDYPAVAADWDAVHVSIAGYLTTAGIAIPMSGSASTMLAGWHPDAAWWLNDVLSFTGPPEDWRVSDRASPGWTWVRQSP
jgi:hypothetical protein